MVRPNTRIVPAIAVPKVEPRLDTLRDRPDISPCCSSGKLDCTKLTEGVSINPRPKPISRSPGTNAKTLDQAVTSPIKSPMPAMVPAKPARIRAFCVRFLENRSAPKDVTRRPSVAAVKIAPVSIAL